jgi:hypothetical protein
MAKIKVEITIPDYEYKEWSDFQESGIELTKQNIKKDISDNLKQQHIRNFDIDVKLED